MKLKFIVGIAAALGLSACATTDNAPHGHGNMTGEEIVQYRDKNPYPVNPVNLRRTTMVVKDMEAALALYRDALGMQVVYDQELSSEGLSMRHKADGKNRSRLVLMQTNSGQMGMVGLWQFLDQTDKDLAEPDPADFTPGEIVLLFHAENLKETFAKASKVAGVKVLGEPHERRYPSPAGDIVVMVSMLVDMNGHTIELNQKLHDPRDAK